MSEDDPTAAPRRLVRLGKERGYVTDDEVEALPRARSSPESVEGVMATLHDTDVHVVPGAGDTARRPHRRASRSVVR